MAKTKKVADGNRPRHKPLPDSVKILRGDTLSRTRSTSIRSDSARALCITDGDHELSRRENVKLSKIKNVKVNATTDRGAATGSYEQNVHNENLESPKSVVVNSVSVMSGNEASTAVDSMVSDNPTQSMNIHENNGKGSATRRIKKSVKRLTPSTTSKKHSAVKLPNFKDIHKKMFEKMESIVVTVQKREQRRKDASTIEVNAGSLQGKGPTVPKPKKVVRKLYDCQTGPSTITSHSDQPEAIKELSPVPVQPKSSESSNIVLQVRSNNDARVFKFTGRAIGSSTPKVRNQPFPDKNIVANRATRSQGMYKGRPAPGARPRDTKLLTGVRLNRRFQLQMEHREKQKESQSEN